MCYLRDKVVYKMIFINNFSLYIELLYINLKD